MIASKRICSEHNVLKFLGGVCVVPLRLSVPQLISGNTLRLRPLVKP